MSDLPAGTVTLLFSDIEGSTRLLRDYGPAYVDLLADHREAIRRIVAEHGGTEVDMEGDAFFLAFPRAADAVEAATDIQREHETGDVRVRLGIHTGEPLVAGQGYVGMDVHTAARICAAAHGGQVLISQATRNLIEADLAELGVFELKDIPKPQRLFQLGHGRFPPPRTSHATNLPVQPTRTIGRRREIRDIIALLAQPDVRLVTLVGPGGVGKTRLSMTVGARLVGELADGAFFVDLSAVRDLEGVMRAIAQVLGAADDPADLIGAREMLIILDNFEHLARAATDVAHLLERCPQLRLLVTSRVRLSVRAEHQYAIDPLAADEAFALFVARAQAAEPDFKPDPAVVEICRRVDGLPLAIELAAARVRALAPAAILERLDRRLQLLTGGARDLPDRQQTLRATIDWSVDLLEPEARRLFARLAIFAGSFDLEAAEQVADADIDGLTAVVEQSLVRRTGARYTMLDTIHELAAEQLVDSGQRPSVQERHARHYAALAKQALAESGRPMVEDDTWLRRFRLEHANFRTALEWLAGAGNGEALYDIVEALWTSWLMIGATRDGEHWARIALELGGDAQAARRPWMMLVRSEFPRFAGDIERAIGLKEAALAAARAADSDRVTAACLHDLGSLYASAGRYDEAHGCHVEGVAIRRRIGEPRGVAHALEGFAELQVFRGSLEDADRLYAEIDAMENQASVDRVRRLQLRSAWAEVRRRMGNWESSELMYEGVLRESAELEFRAGQMEALVGLAAMRAGIDAEHSAVLIGAMEAIHEGTQLGLWDPTSVRGIVADIEDRLTPDAYEAAVQRGRNLQLEEVVTFATRASPSGNA